MHGGPSQDGLTWTHNRRHDEQRQCRHRGHGGVAEQLGALVCDPQRKDDEGIYDQQDDLRDLRQADQELVPVERAILLHEFLVLVLHQLPLQLADVHASNVPQVDHREGDEKGHEGDGQREGEPTDPRHPPRDKLMPSEDAVGQTSGQGGHAAARGAEGDAHEAAASDGLDLRGDDVGFAPLGAGGLVSGARLHVLVLCVAVPGALLKRVHQTDHEWRDHQRHRDRVDEHGHRPTTNHQDE
mmetsp:Transcript_5725/g.16563  ORF Transcript_5725/g.16563 Transcript_5725/m.16563 type:complete len:241 (+) Transcript_5725:1301-2023(+)